jgi:hypothetical protein
MRLMLGTFTALGLALAAPLAPAAAQAQAGIMVGMQVTDSAGGAVGSVAAVKGDNLLIKTDKHEVLLPKTSFTANAGKLLFGMTQAQLNAEIEKSLAAANASIAAGAVVKGASGAEVGKIEIVEGGNVTIALQSGTKIQVPEKAVRGNADGTVTNGYTAEQLEALVADKGGDQSGGQ